jgi:hypothetical protein
MSAGQHILDEFFMPGYVDKAHAQIAQIEIGKTYVDCDPASLFFRQAVGINACQSADESGLPMIDVSRCADDDGFHVTGL